MRPPSAVAPARHNVVRATSAPRTSPPTPGRRLSWTGAPYADAQGDTLKTPDFVIAGAPKAGTTWLYRTLARSPDVFVTENKEPRFFAAADLAGLTGRGPGDDAWLGHVVPAPEAYAALFAGARPGQVRGEASTDYLYRSATAAPAMAAANSAMKLIVILREPVERAYSNWAHHVRDEREPLPFLDAVAAEDERVADGWAWWWHYLRRGRYGQQLGPFLEHFPREQLLVETFDRLRAEGELVAREVFAFLGLEAPRDALTTLPPQNRSRVPRTTAAHRARNMASRFRPVIRRGLPAATRARLRRGWTSLTTMAPDVPGGAREALAGHFDAEVEQTEALTGLDLSAWRTSAPRSRKRPT